MSKEEQFANTFANTFNRHGFGFQYSVINLAIALHEKRDLDEKRVSAFYFEASEFPVEVKGNSTKIDIILARGTVGNLHDYPLNLICECKRADPALSNWCFASAPFTRRSQLNGERERAIIESIWRESGSCYTGARTTFPIKAYHLAFEIKSDMKGDGKGSNKSAIEDAAGQVSRGLNGFIEAITRNPILIKKYNKLDLLPVIFTTAQLYVTDIDISQADIQTGKLSLSASDVKSVSWLYYQYPISPGLRHIIQRNADPKSISDVLKYEYVRTIAIVNPNGIEEFLKEMSEQMMVE